VRVKGAVEGTFEGENAFDGTLSAPELRAESVEVVDATALDPARKTVEVGQATENNGFSVAVEKVEFGEDTTRVCIMARNGTDWPASLFVYDARIVQGSRQIDPTDAYEYASLEPQSDLEPGVETTGVLTFGPADPSTPLNFRLEWYSENYDITPEPLVFTIQP
jgi:hypothetical protein